MKAFINRVAKLEQRLAPTGQRVWQICLHEDETAAEALARHSVPAETSGLVVLLHKYGTCRACEAEGQAHGP